MQSRENNAYKLINKHKKAYFDYEILETLEVGIVLFGSEVKAARALAVNLKDSFVRIMKVRHFCLMRILAHSHIQIRIFAQMKGGQESFCCIGVRLINGLAKLPHKA